MLDKKFNSVEFDACLFQVSEKGSRSRAHLKKMVKAMLENQDFISPVPATTKKKKKKAMDIESEREDRCYKLAEATYSRGARYASSSV